MQDLALLPLADLLLVLRDLLVPFLALPRGLLQKSL
jgi:hypothetical protein